MIPYVSFSFLSLLLTHSVTVQVAAETVTFQLAPSMGSPSKLAVWYSNFEVYNDNPPLMERMSDIVPDGRTGSVSLSFLPLH
jgi:hypothetical protein